MKLQNRKTVKLKNNFTTLQISDFTKNLLPIKSIHRIIHSCENE